MEETAAPLPDPIATLQDVVHAGQRPSPAQEDEGAAALKLKFSGNKAEIESGIAAAAQLPWNVPVKAAAAAWPEMGVTARRSFLSELAKLDSDNGKRLRLSLARGLQKVDPAAAIKIVSTLCAALKKGAGESGLQGKERQSFFNVLIGKGKPWLLQWKWEDFKPAEISGLVFCALSTGFQGNCPPLTQSSLIRWTGASGKIEKLPDSLVAAIRKEIGRWKSKLREQTLADTPNAPDWLKELLSQPGHEPAPAPASTGGEEGSADEAPASSGEAGAEDNGEAPSGDAAPQQRPQQGNRHSNKQQQQPKNQQQRSEKDQQRHEQREQRDQQQREQREQQREQRDQQREQRGAQSGGRGGDPLSLLRQVEAHIQGLRNDVTHAKAQVRQRDDEIRKLKSRGGRRKKSDSDEPQQLSDPQYDSTELARHNAQLEERVLHLQAQLDELAENNEVVAISKQESGEDPQNASREQFKTLVGLKLEELYKGFQELTAGPQNETLVDHYRQLIANIFSGLAEMGIQVPEAEQQVLPARAARSMKAWKSE